MYGLFVFVIVFGFRIGIGFIFGVRILFRSNNMIFLQNYNKMMHAGRTFGHATTPDGKTFACRTLFGSFGNPVHIPDSIVDGDNKYTV